MKRGLSETEIKELSKSIYEELKELENSNNNIQVERLHIDSCILQQLMQTLLSFYSDILKYIDLSEISFDGLNVSYANLEGTNADINPQKVYGKSLCFTNLKNVDMSGKSFRDVCIIGTNLEGTNADINPQKAWHDSLYHTNLKGIDMRNKNFDRIDVRYANLDDTYANINSQTIGYNSLEGTKLKNTILDGKLMVPDEYEELKNNIKQLTLNYKKS